MNLQGPITVQPLPAFTQLKDKASPISEGPPTSSSQFSEPTKLKHLFLSFRKELAHLFQKLWLESHFLSLEAHILILPFALFTLKNNKGLQECSSSLSEKNQPPLRVLCSCFHLFPPSRHSSSRQAES